MKKFIWKSIFVLGVPFTYLSSVWLRLILKKNKAGKVEDRIFSHVGILPVSEHYYEPLIHPKKHLKKSLRDDRILPGIDMNIQEQLNILAAFDYNHELLEFPVNESKDSGDVTFFYNNGFYQAGDAEYLYNMVRHFKPKKIIEIGSGNSTLMAKNAIDKNKTDNKNYQCEHICIEPYEMPWLETKNVKVIRKKVEDIDVTFFEQLEPNDILFIDSSHMIRPQGDVLFEYLEILPVLKAGVIIHIHDIFTPKDYPDEWVFTKRLLWNEQYLLEAFLSFNNMFKIIGATNYLSHHYSSEFAAKCPVFAQQPDKEAQAFWMKRVLPG
ncbi:MAG TPA: class I SAM-dependent methyltransferase [Mucilaginibacter sp.]|jgi:hypothetical protein|nr:class I SAM-dependent methyltransferase [Mucilaginibacter sp.]